MLEDQNKSTPAPLSGRQVIEFYTTAACVPRGPINTFSDALGDAQTVNNEWVEDVTLPNGSKTRTVVNPVRLTSSGLGLQRIPPALDIDREETLRELFQAQKRHPPEKRGLA